MELGAQARQQYLQAVEKQAEGYKIRMLHVNEVAIEVQEKEAKVEDLRSQLSQSNNREELEKQLDEVENFLNTDYGPDRAFRYLHGKCFFLETREYKYELCPFDKITQQSRDGSGRSNLGNWGHWENKYTAFKMTNGDGCWQGPNRSTTIKLQCGTTDRGISVDEPTRCVYEMVFSTPAMCEKPPSQEEMAMRDEL